MTRAAAPASEAARRAARERVRKIKVVPSDEGGTASRLCSTPLGRSPARGSAGCTAEQDREARPRRAPGPLDGDRAVRGGAEELEPARPPLVLVTAEHQPG